MRGGVHGVHPAGCGWPGLHVQAHQLAHAQATAVEQLHHAAVAQREHRVTLLGLVRGERHRVIHAQGLGQGLGRLGRLDAVHRVGLHLAMTAPPLVQAAPGRQGDGDAARAQAPVTQGRAEAPHVVGLHFAQRHGVGLRRGLQPAERVAVHGHGARGQAALNDQMFQKAADLGVQRRGGPGGGLGPCQGCARRPWRRHAVHRVQRALQPAARSRASPALAISPMRARNSVPMSAL